METGEAGSDRRAKRRSQDVCPCDAQEFLCKWSAERLMWMNMCFPGCTHQASGEVLGGSPRVVLVVRAAVDGGQAVPAHVKGDEVVVVCEQRVLHLRVAGCLPSAKPFLTLSFPSLPPPCVDSQEEAVEPDGVAEQDGRVRRVDGGGVLGAGGRTQASVERDHAAITVERDGHVVLGQVLALERGRHGVSIC